MYTEFGIEIRKLRLERGLKLKDMADMLGTSSAYLSAVETGRKPVPPQMPDEIARKMDLDEVTRARLRQAAAKSVRSIRLAMADRSEEAQRLAVTFARRFPTMDEGEVARLLSVLVENGSARRSRHRPVRLKK